MTSSGRHEKKKSHLEKENNCPLRQSNDGLDEAGPPVKKGKLSVVKSYTGCLWLKTEAPWAFAWSGRGIHHRGASCIMTCATRQLVGCDAGFTGSYPWDKNTLGSVSASQKERRRKDATVPRLPQVKSSAEDSAGGTSCGAGRKGRGRHKVSQVLCTHFTKFHSSPVRHTVDLSSSGGMNGVVGRGGECTAGGRGGGEQDGECRAPPGHKPPNLTVS